MRYHMRKIKKCIQSGYIRNAFILSGWSDICNADMNELSEIARPREKVLHKI
jgi:hypothetical protein